ncbi:DMT family transporter [Desertibaculum subflavum]|uniref:DMT family transporter n=1 Tax=Desertibaculum subflavum TaxID=2268458 RepID=UPI0013C50BB7
MNLAVAGADRATLGIAAMALATLVFACNDVVAKWLVGQYGVGQLLLVRSIGAVALVLLVLRGNVGRLVPVERPWLHAGRAALMAFEVSCFYLAVRQLPLADVMVIYFGAPIFVTALSVPLLGERVGWRRALAVVSGFAGIVIAMRPTDVAFALPAAIALAGSLAYGLMLISARSLRGTSAVVLAGHQALGVLALGGIAAFFDWTPVAVPELALMLLVGCVAFSGHALVNWSLSAAPAAVAAPISYLSVVWATILGYLVFGDRPAVETVVGCLVVAGSGLYIFFRERRLGLG